MAGNTKENTLTQDTIKSRLQAARKLIDQLEKWTQKVFRQDVGHGVVAYCVLGALIEVCQAEELDDVNHYLTVSMNRHQPGGPVDLGLGFWNDRPERTHVEVMQEFDRAIEDADANQTRE